MSSSTARRSAQRNSGLQLFHIQLMESKSMEKPDADMTGDSRPLSSSNIIPSSGNDCGRPRHVGQGQNLELTPNALQRQASSPGVC